MLEILQCLFWLQKNKTPQPNSPYVSLISILFTVLRWQSYRTCNVPSSLLTLYITQHKEWQNPSFNILQDLPFLKIPKHHDKPETFLRLCGCKTYFHKVKTLSSFHLLAGGPPPELRENKHSSGARLAWWIILLWSQPSAEPWEDSWEIRRTLYENTSPPHIDPRHHQGRRSSHTKPQTEVGRATEKTALQV